MRRRSLALEPLESRFLMSATVMEHGDIGYFLNPGAARVERYDIAGEVWLSPVTLEGGIGTPTVLNVDADGLYVAFDRAVYRYGLDGTGRTHLFNAHTPVQAIHSDGNLLFVNYTSGYDLQAASINKATNTIVDTVDDYLSATHGSSIAPGMNRIFGRTLGLSPSDITYIAYNDDGTFGFAGESPYHGDYPGASRTWVFPDDAKVVDDSGTIYSTSGLTRLNSFGSRIDDIDFLGTDVPIVLRGNTLTAYSQAILPTGSVSLSYEPTDIFVNDASVIAFTPDAALATGFRADVVSLSELHPAVPGQPINPVGLAYTPDKIEVAADGTLLLYSKSHQSIFRWDPAAQRYLSTIPLVGTAEYMAYSASTNTVYLACQSGQIWKIDLNASAPAEVPFATLPDRPLGLSTAGEYLFAVDPSGAWVTHYTFAPDGTMVDHVDWNYYSREYVWSDANQKMYFFRDDTSPNDLLAEEINASGTAYPAELPGGIRYDYETPLHDSFGFVHPIRVAPDGSVVVLGSGMIHDAKTLARKTLALANSITDAAWVDGELYTVRKIAGMAELQHWALPTYDMTRAAQIAGAPHALLALPGNRLLSITSVGQGVPAFTVMDTEFNVLDPGTSVIAVSDITLAEGTAGETIATFEATLSGPNAEKITVDFTTSDGTAAAGSDYQAASGTVTFAPGESTKTITVVVNADTTTERDESFQLILTNATNAFIGRGQATGTIVNDDQSTLSISDVTLDEGGSGTTDFVFDVTLDAAVDVPVSIGFATSNGTATTLDGDYTATGGRLEFSGTPGETKRIVVSVAGDQKLEPNETFSVTLAAFFPHNCR